MLQNFEDGVHGLYSHGCQDFMSDKMLHALIRRLLPDKYERGQPLYPNMVEAIAYQFPNTVIARKLSQRWIDLVRIFGRRGAFCVVHL